MDARNVDDKTQAFADRLERRIEARRSRRERTRKDLAALYRQVDAEQQALVERSRAERPGRSLAWGTSSASYGVGPQALISLGETHIGVLGRLDRLMWEAFDLDRVFPSQPLGRYPVEYCETLEEFFERIIAAEDVSETARAEVVRMLVEDAERQARASGGGTLGVNLPGRGCYVNGWLFGFVHGTSARTALQDRDVFARVLETVCHEKLGHGFVAALTALGLEKVQLGMWRFDLADRFPLRTVDTPRGALLRQKHNLLYLSSQFAEEGWATWIETYMHWRAARSGLLECDDAPARPGARYTLTQVERILEEVHERLPDLHAVVDRFATATQVLLMAPASEPPSEAEILGAMLIWQTEGSALDDAFLQALGQPVRYVLGYLLLRRLEAQLGWQNLPYAVAIAANVTYDLERIPISDLETLLVSDPRLNVDARLALLGMLELSPGTGLTDLAHQAREEISLAVPEGW